MFGQRSPSRSRSRCRPSSLSSPPRPAYRTNRRSSGRRPRRSRLGHQGVRLPVGAGDPAERRHAGDRAGRNTLRRIHQGVLDPTPITGTAAGHHQHAPRHRRRRGHRPPEVRGEPLHLRRVLEAATGGCDSADIGIRTAVLLRARYDGGSALQDVSEIFASTSRTDGPSAARLVFGRDGKIYMAHRRARASTSAPAAPPTRRTRPSTSARSCG